MTLDNRLPYAPNRGDRIRSYHLLQHMASYATIDVVSLVHDDEEAGHAGDLRGLAATVAIARVGRLRGAVRTARALLGTQPVTHALLDSGAFAPAITEAFNARQPDLVFVYCPGVAPCVLLAPLDRIPFIIDLVDVDSEKWAELARSSGWPRRWIYSREARYLSRFERKAAARARMTLVHRR